MYWKSRNYKENSLSPPSDAVVCTGFVIRGKRLQERCLSGFNPWLVLMCHSLAFPVGRNLFKSLILCL